MEVYAPLICCVLLVGLFLGGILWAYSSGWNARDESADAQLELVGRDLDLAHQALEAAQDDLKRQVVGSERVVQAARAVAAARAAAVPARQRRRMLLSAGGGPVAESPPASREAAGPVAGNLGANGTLEGHERA